MQGSVSNWKTAILADFAEWLKGLPETPPEPPRTREKRRGLADIYSEVAALRQEVVLQSRSQQKSMVGLDAARAALSELGAQLRGQLDAPNGALARQRADPEALAVITSFLEIRDALVRTQALAHGLVTPEGPLASPDADTASLAQTLDLILRKFDRTLEDHGVSRIDTVGIPFDPSRMSAVGTRNEPDMTDGTVVEEIRGGFLLGDSVLRTAEVFVNMCDQTQGDRDE